MNELFAGSPRFSKAGLITAQGIGAAWRAALDPDPGVALSGIAGDFAVGVRLSGSRVLLAVDRFAIRSICYRVDQGQIRFAERADTLADSARSIDPQAIFDYLYFHVIPSPRTIYKGVFRLPAGHYALFEHGQLSVAPYWVPDFNEGTRASFDASLHVRPLQA